MREPIRTDAGNSIVLIKDDWAAALLASSDRHDYIKSPELIRGLDFDVIVLWATSLDGSYYDSTGKSDIGRCIDEIPGGCAVTRSFRQYAMVGGRKPLSAHRRRYVRTTTAVAHCVHRGAALPEKSIGWRYRQTGNEPATDQQPERTKRTPMTGQGGSVAVFRLYKGI